LAHVLFEHQPYVAISVVRRRGLVMLLSPLRVFLLINDQQTVPLEGTKTCLQGSQHRHRDISGVTFKKRACNDIALVGDTVLAFGDESISLG
jgi:hypothetical protein